MKSSVSLPDALKDRLTEYNRRHPGDKIIVSGICVEALEKKLDEVEGVINNVVA